AAFGEHARREWPERLAELDLRVHDVLHLGAAGGGEDRARAERTRAELEPAAGPAADPAGEENGDPARGETLLVLHLAEGEAVLAQKVGDLGVVVRAAEVGVAERRDARLAEQVVICPQRRADRAAVVARRRRNVELLEAGLAQDLRVRHRIQ